MKQILAILFFFTGSNLTDMTNTTAVFNSTNQYYYLALGDSYTIGEKVPAAGNFPNQVTTLLKENSIDMQPARIIATTGWTTNELEAGIVNADKEEKLRSSYDLVTLLIGVNNQYRGRSLSNYKPEFEELLKKAIRYAGDNAEHVIVLSIPDWGVTPFAEGRDRQQIAKEIDGYNFANKEITRHYKVTYIDITPWTREASHDPSLLAEDGLHPSAKEYKRWAEKIFMRFKELIK